MKPCDCKDHADLGKLDHSGVSFNGNSLDVHPVTVSLTVGPCTIKMSQRLFEKFARWYLEDQDYIAADREAEK